MSDQTSRKLSKSVGVVKNGPRSHMKRFPGAKLRVVCVLLKIMMAVDLNTHSLVQELLMITQTSECIKCLFIG